MVRSEGDPAKTYIVFGLIALLGGGGGSAAIQGLTGPEVATERELQEFQQHAREERHRLRDEMLELLNAAIELDKKAIELEIAEQRHQFEIRLNQLELGIREDMPPAATRSRIRELERAMGKLDPTFEPPTQDWQ